MFACEIESIATLRTLSTFGGVNIHSGGKGGCISCSVETREKLSRTHKQLHEMDPSLREASKLGRIKWIQASQNNASERAKLAWETKRKKAAADPAYAARLHAAAVKRGKLGKEAQMFHDAVPSEHGKAGPFLKAPRASHQQRSQEEVPQKRPDVRPLERDPRLCQGNRFGGL